MGHSQTLSLLNPLLECRIVDLLVKRRIITTLSIYIVRQHRLAIVHTTNRGVGVCSTVRMECGLSEISSES
jgi:hypothetical protein